MAEGEIPPRLPHAIRVAVFWIGLPFIGLLEAIERYFNGTIYQAAACVLLALLSVVVAVYWDRLLPRSWRRTASNAPQATPPTMFEIFKSEMAGYAGKFEETEIIFSNGTKSKLNTTICLNFEAGSKFIAFFVPHSPLSLQTYQALALQTRPIFTRLDTNIGMSVKRLGEHGMTESADLTFTGFVYLYCEDSLSVHDLSDLTKQFDAVGLKLRVKDQNYYTLKLLEWHNSKGK